MTLRFTKMHGLGNDFMMIDAISQPVKLHPQDIAALSKRDTGIGFDQCLVIEKSPLPEIDFLYRIFNADGQEVGQCGNGARCLARFVHHQRLTTKTTLHIKTNTTTMQLSLHDDHSVTVAFNAPQLSPADIPLIVSQPASSYSITLDQPYHFHAINVGNPHAVLIVDDIHQADVTQIGAQLSTHPLFPAHTNVGFMQILSAHHVKLRVYERGCGETQACGSGAVAAMAVGSLYHHLAETVTVSLPGGDLIVSWPQHAGAIFLRGPATFVYDGQLLEDLL